MGPLLLQLAGCGLGLKWIEIKDGIVMKCWKYDLVHYTRGVYQQHMKQYYTYIVLVKDVKNLKITSSIFNLTSMYKSSPGSDIGYLLGY